MTDSFLGLLGEKHVLDTTDLLSVSSSLRRFGRVADCRAGERLGDVFQRHGLTTQQQAGLWRELSLARAGRAPFGSQERAMWVWSASLADSIRQAAERLEREE